MHTPDPVSSPAMQRILGILGKKAGGAQPVLIKLTEDPSGFVRVGLRKNYYRTAEGREHAVLMTLEFGGEAC